MKNLNKLILSCSGLLFFQIGFAQVKINTYASTSNIPSGTQFIDGASSSGKGLVFPRADLTTLAVAGSSANKLDGMLVYNTATGTSLMGGAIAVKPGFYYYSNKTTNVATGTWIAVGSGAGGGSTALGITATGTDYTLLETDSTVLCDAATAAFTLTLPDPAAVGMSGKTYVIRKVDITDNAIGFSPVLYFTKTDTVASLNYTKTIRIQSDGTKWNIID
jgi:hypothetical protein